MSANVYDLYLSKTLNNIFWGLQWRIHNIYVIGDKYLEILNIDCDKKILWEIAVVGVVKERAYTICNLLNNLVTSNPSMYINILIALTEINNNSHNVKLNTEKKIFSVKLFSNGLKYSIIINLLADGEPYDLQYVSIIDGNNIYSKSDLMRNDYLNIFKYMSSLKEDDPINQKIIKAITEDTLICSFARKIYISAITKPLITSNTANINTVYEHLSKKDNFEKKINICKQLQFASADINDKLEKLSNASYLFLSQNDELKSIYNYTLDSTPLNNFIIVTKFLHRKLAEQKFDTIVADIDSLFNKFHEEVSSKSEKFTITMYRLSHYFNILNNRPSHDEIGIGDIFTIPYYSSFSYTTEIVKSGHFGGDYDSCTIVLNVDSNDDRYLMVDQYPEGVPDGSEREIILKYGVNLRVDKIETLYPDYSESVFYKKLTVLHCSFADTPGPDFFGKTIDQYSYYLPSYFSKYDGIILDFVKNPDCSINMGYIINVTIEYWMKRVDGEGTLRLQDEKTIDDFNDQLESLKDGLPVDIHSLFTMTI
jgi:hypothetical protein